MTDISFQFDRQLTGGKTTSGKGTKSIKSIAAKSAKTYGGQNQYGSKAP